MYQNKVVLYFIPHFAICIAIQYQGKIEYTIIHDPLLNETFSASRNQHAQLNRFRIQVNDSKELSSKLILAGNQLAKLQRLAANISIRETGCNALMLAYVANGRFDGFAGNGLSEFELAAGSLLIHKQMVPLASVIALSSYNLARYINDCTNPGCFSPAATSVPLYWNRENLPIGSQFVGRYGDEVTFFLTHWLLVLLLPRLRL